MSYQIPIKHLPNNVWNLGLFPQSIDQEGDSLLKRIWQRIFQNAIYGMNSLTRLVDRVTVFRRRDSESDNTNFIEGLTEHELFELSLNTWLRCGGNESNKPSRQTAVDKIRDVYETQKTELNLSFLELTTSPEAICYLKSLKTLTLACNHITEFPEVVTKLKDLESLSLGGNQISSLPDSIGELTNLQTLWFYRNKLESIPSVIGNLRLLKELSLEGNKLTFLPDTIGNLSRLERLWLEDNQLSTLPETIGYASSLQKLWVSGNNLTTLPNSIGNLSMLRDIKFENNPNLNSLPMTLGNCRSLLSIDYRGTRVSNIEINAIETRIRADRVCDSYLELPDRLNTWYSYCPTSSEFNFSSKLYNFTKEECSLIGEWLNRLEGCADFQKKRNELATLVCKILETLGSSSSFKNAFFAQLEGNLERCEDRSSMLLNMIFTEWLIYSIAQDAKVKDKIVLLIRLAKTLSLRYTLNKMILAFEKKQGRFLQESVEIYLFYEIKLKKSLGLLTAIDNMSYPDIVNHYPINERKLINQVNANYMKILVEFPALDKTLESCPQHGQKYKKKRNSIIEITKKDMSRQDSQKSSSQSDTNYLNAFNAIKLRREIYLSALRKSFVKKYKICISDLYP